jgi:hypothetical protein
MPPRKHFVPDVGSATVAGESVVGPVEVTIDLEDPRLDPFLDAFVDMIVEDLLADPPRRGT